MRSIKLKHVNIYVVKEKKYGKPLEKTKKSNLAVYKAKTRKQLFRESEKMRKIPRKKSKYPEFNTGEMG